MIDGNQLREEFGRYLAEHKETRWGMDAALMHVCKIAYDAGKADGPGEHLNGAAEILDRALSEHMKRSVKVEQTLLDIASGRRPMLTPDECRTLSLALGTPYEAQTDAQRAMLAADDYMKEAERLLSEYGDAVSDAVVFAQDPAGYSMRMEEATRAALLAHIQRGAVPEGWQLVPKEPTPEMLAGGWGYWLNVMAPGKQRDTAAKEYAAMLAAAPAPDQFRDAAKMMAEPAEVPMPEPIGFIDSNDEETWATLTQNAHELATLKLRSTVFHVSQMRTYGDARETAGYARGRVVEKALRGLLNIIDDSRGVDGYHLNGDIAEWDDFPEVEAAKAALRGEVKP